MERAMLLASTVAASLLSLASVPGPSASPDPMAPMHAQLVAARQELVDNFVAIQKRSGLAPDLEERLDADIPTPWYTSKPAWMSPADFTDYMTYLAKLDASLVHQYATGAYHLLGEVRGADDTAFRSPADGTMQPLAVYVPPSYDPRKATSLVVFLHGRTWSENDLIAQPWVRAAADSTGSIVVAPYARGDSQYVEPAPEEVYAALDVARKAFNIDERRVYLAGHSMGGYGVFIVAPKHPARWAAVLAASGGMTTETMQAALRGLQGIPVYLVVGSDDPIVPGGYMQHNADLLRESGIETHYYEQPGGQHSIGTIAAAFERAWRDMLATTRRSAPPRDVTSFPTGQPLNPNVPPPSTRP